jgi:hypothetical protein
MNFVISTTKRMDLSIRQQACRVSGSASIPVAYNMKIFASVETEQPGTKARRTRMLQATIVASFDGTP